MGGTGTDDIVALAQLDASPKADVADDIVEDDRLAVHLHELLGDACPHALADASSCD